MIDTVAIPLHTLPDGRRFISEQDAIEQPYIIEFIGQFPNYWTYDPVRCGWVSPILDEVA